MNYDHAEYVPLFKTLADETRLKIIDMLACGEMCACKILENFNITQPTLSYHMKMLCDSGVVACRRDGAWMYYRLSSDKLENICQFLSSIKYDNNVHTNKCCDDEKCTCK